ncbi:hypothetical protein BJX62DRAFT_241871 [Aspergillus germanicus]
MFSGNELVNSVVVAWIVGYALHHFNLLFTLPVDPRDIYKHSALKEFQKNLPLLSLRGRVPRALHLATSLRALGTPYEVMPSRRTKGKPETGTNFLAHNLAVALLEYLILDFMTLRAPSPETTARWFGEGREYLLFRPYGLPRPTARDIVTNMIVASITGGALANLAIDLSYRLAAIISVGLGQYRPSQWPPLFGSVMEAYTIRRFWR